MKKILSGFIGLLFITTFVYAAQDRSLPNPDLTPGVTLNVTKEDICTPGYSKSVRNVPQSEKRQVYEEYSIKPNEPPCPCEVDHLISLELGGSNDIKNLWSESYAGKWNAHMKDRLENWLHKQVCEGRMSLQEAQDAIRNDWIKAYKKYGIGKVGNKGYVEKIVH